MPVSVAEFPRPTLPAPQISSSFVPNMTAAPDTPAAWARPLHEEHIALLGRLAHMGMGLAETIERQVKTADAEGEPVSERAPIDFARVARAVRLTLMLRARLIKDLEDRDRAVAQGAAWAATNVRFERDDLANDRKARVTRIVERIAGRQYDDAETIERLIWETGERLDGDDLYGHVLDRPVSELIDMLCRDMGLDPDWPSLAQEAWAREEMAGGDPGWPFAGLAARSPEMETVATLVPQCKASP
jgi:hypothetical protein